MLLTKTSCCYVMKERKGPCLRYQAFHVEISTKMEIWTLAAFIGYDRQGLLLASKDTVTSQLLDVSLLIDQTNLLWTVANGLDKIVVGFIKNGLNGLSSSLKNDFLQRKSLKNKQTNKQTDRQKQKKEKTPNEKKENILYKNIYHNGPMEFQSYLFRFILTLFRSFYGTSYSV